MFSSFLSTDTHYYTTFKAFARAISADPRGSYRERQMWGQVMRFMRVYRGAEVTVNVLSEDRCTSSTHILLRRGQKSYCGVVEDAPNTLLHLDLRMEDLEQDASSHITLNIGTAWLEVPFHFRVDWFQKTSGKSVLKFALTKRQPSATLKEIEQEIMDIVNHDLPMLLGTPEGEHE